MSARWARRTRLRGRANVEKRHLLQAAGANLALVMRTLFGLGAPRGWAARPQAQCLALLVSARALLRWWGLIFGRRSGCRARERRGGRRAPL